MCLTGFMTDRLPDVSDIHKVRVCNSLAFNGCALSLLAASFAGIANRTVAVALVVAAFCTLGINAGGFFKSVVLVSRQHSPVVMTGVQIFLCLTLFADSFIVPELTIHAMFDEYKHVFWIYAAGLVISNAIFVLLAKAEPAEWTRSLPMKA
ncbi:Protein Y51B9A.6 b [Aphelenchoides avenae]|nr:Protein Y51B9A.6 b [Aphelenchus avenae]